MEPNYKILFGSRLQELIVQMAYLQGSYRDTTASLDIVDSKIAKSRSNFTEALKNEIYGIITKANLTLSVNISRINSETNQILPALKENGQLYLETIDQFHATTQLVEIEGFLKEQAIAIDAVTESLKTLETLLKIGNNFPKDNTSLNESFNKAKLEILQFKHTSENALEYFKNLFQVAESKKIQQNN